MKIGPKISPAALAQRIEYQKLIQQEMIKQQQLKVIKERQVQIQTQKGSYVDEMV